jgi:hypothetical protein
MRPSTNTDIAGAQMLYDKALKFNPDHPTVLYNYAVLLEDARQVEIQSLIFFNPPPPLHHPYAQTFCPARGCAPGKNSQESFFFF